MESRIARSLRILTAGLVLSAGVVPAVMADDAAIISQRLAAMGLGVCAVTPAVGGQYHVQVAKLAPGTVPARGLKPGPCPFSIDARFEGGVLMLDKEGLGRAGLVFPLLPPGVKIVSLPGSPHVLQATNAMPPTALKTMQHSLDHAKEIGAEALAELEAIKNTSAEANAILGSCPVPDMGTIEMPFVEALSPHLSHESPEPIGLGSCARYVDAVGVEEGNCTGHLENIRQDLEGAENVKKLAADNCAGNTLSTSANQSLKSDLVTLQSAAAADATRIDALIARIQQLINEYLACIKSK